MASADKAIILLNYTTTDDNLLLHASELKTQSSHPFKSTFYQWQWNLPRNRNVILYIYRAYCHAVFNFE